MRYEQRLGSTHKDWVKIEVTLGTNDSDIEEIRQKLLTFLKSFNVEEMALLNTASNRATQNLERDLGYNAPTVKLLMAYRFVTKTNLPIAAEFYGSHATGSELKKDVFYRVVEDLFQRDLLPTELYAYSAFRRRGSPVTWLKVDNNQTEAEFKLAVDDKVNKLRYRLTAQLGKARRLRFKVEVKGYVLYFFEKGVGAEVIKTEHSNQEAQKMTYSILAIRPDEKAIGYVSGVVREIGEVQNFFKKEVFPNQIYTPRNDLEFDPKELLQKLITPPDTSTLVVTGLSLKKVHAPSEPALRLESTNEESIALAIENLRPLWEDLDISHLREVVYQTQLGKVGLYSGGDDWNRQRLNVKSQGKSRNLESSVILEIELLLSANIKEVRFVTEVLKPQFVINKLLEKELFILTNPIPKVAEEILVNLIRSKIFNAQQRVAKRKCKDCHTISWKDLECQNCGGEMIIIGQGISVKIEENNLMRTIQDYLQTSFPQHSSIYQPSVQRKNYKKSVVFLTSAQTNVAIYLINVATKNDLTFCKVLSEEGYGIVALIHPNLKGKIDDLRAMDCSIIELSYLLGELNSDFLNGTPALTAKVEETFDEQIQSTLLRIYRGMQDSTTRLSNKPIGYTDGLFEVDVKNILQALLPNVVRLGAKFSGQKVPDGYCAFPINHRVNGLFGWDAKYTATGRYQLSQPDLNKQRGYLNWLSTHKEPKALGRLRIYAFITNSSDLSGFRTTLAALKNSPECPRNCRIILMEDRFMCELSKWVLTHWQQILAHGPEISNVFFKWILRRDTRTYGWALCSYEKWPSLENDLQRFVQTT